MLICVLPLRCECHDMQKLSDDTTIRPRAKFSNFVATTQYSGIRRIVHWFHTFSFAYSGIHVNALHVFWQNLDGSCSTVTSNNFLTHEMHQNVFKQETTF